MSSNDVHISIPVCDHEKAVFLSSGGGQRFPQEVCRAFIVANRTAEAGNTEEWHIFDDGSGCGRFFGNLGGMEEFKELAESAYLVLCEIDPNLLLGRGCEGFLAVMYDTAFAYETPLLRSHRSIWGAEGEADTEAMDELFDRWQEAENGRPSYPLHPLRHRLHHNLFTSAMAVIRMIVNPERSLLVGDYNDQLPVAIQDVVESDDGDDGREEKSRTHKQGERRFPGARCYTRMGTVTMTVHGIARNIAS